MTQLQDEILPSSTALGDWGKVEVTPSRAEVMGDNDIPANPPHPLFFFFLHKTGGVQTFPITLCLPSLRAKIPTTTSV